MFYDEIMSFFFRRLSYFLDGFLLIILGEVIMIFILLFYIIIVDILRILIVWLV